MIIQAISYGEVKEEPFAFTYSGNFTDNRVDGVGTVRLNTSGTLTVTGSPVTIIAKIVGAGGGAAAANAMGTCYGAGGGSGGIQEVTVTLEAGTYEIVIGTGGAERTATSAGTAGKGGDTTAFGKTSTGGDGGYFKNTSSQTGGAGGTPNGNSGSTGKNDIAGGAPNGGSVVNKVAQAGGDGYVELTFS